jgi:hypothetical protein
MKFQLPFDVPENVLKLSHHDAFVCLGSCFAESMSDRLQYSGFRTHTNPFGVIFHPIALAEIIRGAMREEKSVRTVEREDVWLCWDAASQSFAFSEAALISQILEARSVLRSALAEASTLLITFGTAWGYRLQASGEMVANCHKFPAQDFQKELTAIDEMVDCWKGLLAELQVSFPHLKVVFTVSPVRHVKDGLMENNRSKARLIELVHSCCESGQAHYFPAYEILMDELRDYRFYAEDLVHPASSTTDFIWERFRAFAFTKESLELAREVEDLRRALAHVSLHPGSGADKKRIAALASKVDAFKSAHPEINPGI